ncbi:MAG TPA: MDR family MFS transporter [Bauldia sp.]|nr:MDR family MFS transporter [Bauldia sp.]
MNAPASVPARLSDADIRIILVGVMLAMFLGALDQTIVATALPTIGRELGDVQGLSWVVTAYLLTSVVVTPIYGKLSDIHGRRVMLLIAIAVFLIGSVACALSRDIFVLIAARAFQGLGGGALISLGQTIVGDIVPPAERGRYQAYFAAVFVTSSVGGPVLGGFFAEYLHWSFIFWINLPLGLAAWLLTNRVLRRLPRHEQPHRIDVIGALLMLAATISLLLALTFGGTTYRWISPEILGLLAASLTGWLLFAWRLASAEEPFIPLSVLGHQVVRNGVISLFFAVGALVGLSVFIPLYFEAVLGLSAAGSGVALVSLMGGAVAGATLAGRIMARFARYKRVSVIGLGLATLVMLVLAVLPSSLPFIGVEIVLAIVGIGIGTVFPITITAVQNAVPLRQLGTTTGVLNFSRSLGGAILVPAFSAVFLASATADSDLVSVQAVILEGGRYGVDFGDVFRGVFVAATIALLMAFAFQAAMKELPLRKGLDVGEA